MERVFKYNPKGVCAREMLFVIDNDIIKKIEIVGGCSGNSQGISKLCMDRNINDVIDSLRNIKCGNKNTSCPDQLAIALEQYKLSK